MVVSDLSIQRPVMAFVLSAVLIVLGVIGFQRLPVRELPKIDYPIISVFTTYPGASPEVVDNEITERIERVVTAISDIRTIRSRSSEGTSFVNIEFNVDRDLESAANDVRDRISRIAPFLPETVDPPQVTKNDSDSQPIMFLMLRSDKMDRLEITDFARRYVLDAVNTVPGVSGASMMGARIYAMRIWLDRVAMAARGVTVQDVEDALRRANTELPAGRIESASREFTVRTDTRLATAEEFGRIVLRRTGENVIRFSDIARVEVGAADERSAFRYNGEDRTSVSIGVIRQSTANTVDVANGIRKLLEEMQPTLPDGMELSVTVDDSVFIRQSIKEVFLAIGIAVTLVMGVIWLFLGTLRATAIPVVAIPVSLVAAMAVLAAMGFSLNVLTLLAFVLAVGLVVDDAIIVVENAMRRIEEGEPPLLASFLGARQIGFAVIATTLVLSAVILPLSALEGTQGKLLREFAVALIAALVFSCLVALTLSPMLCSKILASREQHGRLFTTCQNAFTRVAELYARLLDRVLQARSLVLGVLAAIVILSVGIFLIRPQELAPYEDRGVFIANLQGPEGSTLEYMTNELKQFENVIRPYRTADGPVLLMGANINAGFGPPGVHRGGAVVRLKPWDERSMTAQEVAAQIRPKVAAMPGSRVTISFPNPMAGGGGANQIQFVIGGNTFEELVEWREALLERLGHIPGIVNWQSNYEENKPQLRVRVDRERAADLGVNAADIGRTLETMMGGRQVTRYLDRGEEYDVMLRASDAERTNPRDLSNIYIRGTGSQRLIPLENLIKVSETAGATELSRYNRLRAITITGVLDEHTSMGEAITQVRAAVRDALPAAAHLNFEGAARQQLEATQSIAFAFGMALLAAFLVLSAQFENFRLPAIILLAAPPAIFGGMVAIQLTGMSVNIYTEIGLIMLIGMVAKNAILMVEFANQLRDEGRSVNQAIREAAQLRFRPIVMTSIATVFGALPLALASGAGAEARRAIGWVIVGGLTIGTGLALFITPVLYQYLATGVQPVGAVRQRLKSLMARRGVKEAPAE